MYCIYRSSNPFQTLSLGFIPKIFLKFRKFQLQYSYKIYHLIEKRVYGRSETIVSAAYQCEKDLIKTQSANLT